MSSLINYFEKKTRPNLLNVLSLEISKYEWSSLFEILTAIKEINWSVNGVWNNYIFDQPMPIEKYI